MTKPKKWKDFLLSLHDDCRHDVAMFSDAIIWIVHWSERMNSARHSPHTQVKRHHLLFLLSCCNFFCVCCYFSMAFPQFEFRDCPTCLRGSYSRRSVYEWYGSDGDVGCGYLLLCNLKPKSSIINNKRFSSRCWRWTEKKKKNNEYISYKYIRRGEWTRTTHILIICSNKCMTVPLGIFDF